MTERVLSWQVPASENERPDSAGAAVRATTGGGGGEGVEPICIGVVGGPLHAEIARGYLEQAGITVYLQGDAIASVYGMVAGPLAEVRVVVPASQAEEAARIFAELDFGGGPSDLGEDVQDE
jgi:hypothetical protein